MNNQLKITFLGTSASIPSVRRNLPSMIIQKNGFSILCDCGEGVQLQLQKANISPSRVRYIFISHLHGDHIFGLNGLLTTQQLLDRTAPLTLIGPKGIKDYVDFIQHLSSHTLKYPLMIKELEDSEDYTLPIDHFSVVTKLLDHSMPCHGFRFVEEDKPGKFDQKAAEALNVPQGPQRQKLQQGKAVTLENGRKIQPEQIVGPPIPGRIITYCTDTRPCDAALKLADHANVLVYESTFSQKHHDRALQTYHSTAKQAAEIADNAQAGVLYLYHISQRNDEEEEETMLREAREIFPNSFLPQDLESIFLDSTT
ncbi:ribonuclease Z [candidate division KSB1 bacterium]|nr:ribonuclease Z [candidate division KSB1 bacterium]